MADEWYYTRDNQQAGPIPWAQLQAMAGSGQIAPTDLVWTEGAPQWSSAHSIPGLFSDSAPMSMSAAPLAYTYGVGQLHTPGAFVYAGFWLRFAAWFIDEIILVVAGGVAGGIVGACIGIAMARSGNANHVRQVAGPVGNVIGIIIGWLYYALMESSAKQATLGKMALGIRVVDMQGGQISFGKATGRFFGRIVSALTIGIGYMMAGWTEKKQALHDIMANCLVIRTR